MAFVFTVPGNLSNRVVPSAAMPMPKFIECANAGHHQGDLIFRLIAEDGQVFEFQITLDCFMGLFTMGWKVAENLPPAPAGKELRTTGLESTQLAFATVNTQPGLALVSGPLVLALALTEQQAASLRDEIGAFVAKMDPNRGQTH